MLPQQVPLGLMEIYFGGRAGTACPNFPAPGGRERLFAARLPDPPGGLRIILVFQADPQLPRGRLSEPNCFQSQASDRVGRRRGGAQTLAER